MGKKKIELKVKPCADIVWIRQCDLPFLAKKSGLYRLESDLHFDHSDVAAITVAANSVTIDLNQFTIDLRGKGIQAIAATGVTQLRIENGNIKNSSFTPLQTVTIPPFNPIPVFPNITVAAIRLDSSSNVNIDNINIDNVLYGVVGTNMISDIVVNKLQVFHFGQIATVSGLTQPVGGGLILSGASLSNNLQDVTITNCQIESTTGYNAILLNFTNGFAIKKSQCTAGRVAVVGQTLGCYTFTDSSSGVVKDSVGRYSTQPFFALRVSGIDVIGNEIYNTNHNGMEFVFSNNCSYQNNTVHQVLDDPTVGFLGSGIKVTVGNFFAVKGNVVSGFTIGTSLVDSNGAGISIGASTNCIIQDNVVYGNNFGIKEILSEDVGPPPPKVGTPSTYLRNTATADLVQNYVGIPPALISTTPATAGAWVNIDSP